MKWKRKPNNSRKFKFVFYQWRVTAPPCHFSPLSIRNRCSSIPDYFYPTFHYHNKTHAWTKDKLKETAQPKTWIWEAYFHLSFLSSILLFCSFLFTWKNWKRHAFSFSLCLIMVLFRSAPLYKASLEPCTGIAEQPEDYPDSLQQNHQPLQQMPQPSVPWMLHTIISVTKEPCQDKVAGTAAVLCRHQCGQCL